jgi:hypothetical protein
MGVRGLLETENNYVSIQNFVSWVQKYKTEKDSAMVHVINMVNSIHFDNNMEVDYTEQEKSINDILNLQDEKLKLLKIVRYTSVMPAILYSIFVSTKLLEDNEYLNFMEIAKNFIKVKNASNERNPLIHFVSSIDFLQNKDSLQEQKAKQFAIIKFLKSKKNVRLKIG